MNNTTTLETTASALGLTVKNHKCKCPFHADKNPSLVLWPSINAWKCYGCGEKGKEVDLVMKMLGMKYSEAMKWLETQYGTSPISTTTQHSNAIGNDCLDTSVMDLYPITANAFCTSLVATGILTIKQLQHASLRYHLGTTQDGGIVFWQMDEAGKLYDGKIMFYLPDCHRDHSHTPTWVSHRMKKRGSLARSWTGKHCLFGQHLLTKGVNIAIVESEKTAIICSELLANLTAHDAPFIWLASGGKSALKPEMFLPLKGHRIILFPDTDPDGSTYRGWSEIAKEAEKLISSHIYVSPILEDNATAEQKKSKIDLADIIS